LIVSVGTLGLLCPVLLRRFVVSDSTSGGGAHRPVMADDVTRHTTDRCSLQTSLCFRASWGGTQGNQAEQSNKHHRTHEIPPLRSR
jgi:hypothetical protein